MMGWQVIVAAVCLGFGFRLGARIADAFVSFADSFVNELWNCWRSEA